MYYDNFKELCSEYNVNPSQISKATGISTATFTSWKQGKYTPKQDKLQLIADYFNVSVDYLMTGKEKTFEEYGEIGTILGKIAKDTELCKALQQYFELPDARKKQVISIIEAFHENLR